VEILIEVVVELLLGAVSVAIAWVTPG